MPPYINLDSIGKVDLDILAGRVSGAFSHCGKWQHDICQHMPTFRGHMSYVHIKCFSGPPETYGDICQHKAFFLICLMSTYVHIELPYVHIMDICQKMSCVHICPHMSAYVRYVGICQAVHGRCSVATVCSQVAQRVCVCVCACVCVCVCVCVFVCLETTL